MSRRIYTETTRSPRPPIAAVLLPILLLALGAVFSAAVSAGEPATEEGSARSSASPEPLAVVGGTLVDGTGAEPVVDAVVLVEAGRIACAGTRQECPVPEGVRTVDAAGGWVVPGLVDAHVHFSQTGWADGRPDSLDVRSRHPYPQVIDRLEEHPEPFLRAHLCSGTTTVFDVGGYPWTFDLPARAAADPRAPRVRVAGPLLSTWDFWLDLPAEKQFLYLPDRQAAEEGVRYLAARGAHAAKVWYIDADRPADEMAAVVDAAGAEARRRGLPLIVHATKLDLAKTALRAGADLLVHSVEDRPVDDEFLELARRAGTVYTPTLTVGAGYQRMFEAATSGRAPEIDDPHGCVGPTIRARVAETAELGEIARREGFTAERLEARAPSLEERQRRMDENLVAVHRAGIPVAMGTDAGNPLTLHGPSVYAELEAMEAAGMSPAEVLVAATLGGARAMGLEEEIGTLEEGKAADLLVLRADPTASTSAWRDLRWVVRGGTLHSAPSLAQAPPTPR